MLPILQHDEPAAIYTFHKLLMASEPGLGTIAQDQIDTHFIHFLAIAFLNSLNLLQLYNFNYNC